jgi:hypothetical protein
MISPVYCIFMMVWKDLNLWFINLWRKGDKGDVLFIDVLFIDVLYGDVLYLRRGVTYVCISLRIRNHMQQLFNLWISDPRGIHWWKKNRGSNIFAYIRRIQSPHLRMPNPGFNPGFTPLLYNKCGGEPRVKPGVWRPEMWAQIRGTDNFNMYGKLKRA